MKACLMLSNEFVPLANAATLENNALCCIPLPYDTFDGLSKGPLLKSLGVYSRQQNRSHVWKSWTVHLIYIVI
jgi:hypothetical protein